MQHIIAKLFLVRLKHVDSVAVLLKPLHMFGKMFLVRVAQILGWRIRGALVLKIQKVRLRVIFFHKKN